MTPQPLTDSQIHAAFQARAAGSPSPDLADRIESATRATRQQRPFVVLPGGLGVQPQRLLWAAAISATSLALVGGLLLAGNQNDDDLSVAPSPVPSESPSAVPAPTPSAPPSEAPSPSPTADPTADPSAPPAVDPQFAIDEGLITLVGDLRVRSAPTVDESSARLEPLLPAGVRLLVIEAPVAADGYLWYHVMPFESGYPNGWVAAGSRDNESWITLDETPCPELPLDGAELAALGPWGGLACFGDQEIQLTGELECSFADVDLFIAGPSWIFDDRLCTIDLGDTTMDIHDGGMPVEYGPGRSNGTITGHFADPESSTCEVAIEDVDPPPNAAEIIASCRAMFVGTDWTSVPID